MSRDSAHPFGSDQNLDNDLSGLADTSKEGKYGTKKIVVPFSCLGCSYPIMYQFTSNQV